jgi:NADH-quinone oxidoreductase subunit M
VLTFLPLVGAFIVMLLPRPKDLPEPHGEHGDESHGEPDLPTPALPPDPARNRINMVALVVAGLNFLISLALFGAFKSGTPGMQFVENHPWITMGNVHIRYHLGVDGISLLLIVLTTFLMVLSVLYSMGVKQRLKEFMVFLLLLETGMIGVFCALDLVLFYVFWEAMLIPMYFLIGIFGHENRIYAAVKFFLYTFAGSILMLVAIVGVYSLTGSFDVVALSDSMTREGALLHGTNPRLLMWMFSAFALAFMIKVPMFPFHTWLPDAHVEAPTAGSVILAGVLLKMGTYGFLRFCLPLFPDQAKTSAWLFISLAIIGIVYGSIVAAVQPDAKKLVAYSSVAHLGFVVLGIFTFTPVGMMGALIQNINHGISTPMLFFLVGMLYERRHTRLISEFGGLKRVVPMLATMTLLATLASIAVPFFNGFVGEFPILVGSWTSAQTQTLAGFWPTAFAASGMILSAVYMLWWFQRIMLGPVTKPVNRHLPDLTRTEWIVLTPLAAVIFWIGLFSPFWTERMDAAVATLLPYSARQLEDTLPITQKLNEGAIKQEKAAAKARPTSIREQFQQELIRRRRYPTAPPAGPGGGAPIAPAPVGRPGNVPGAPGGAGGGGGGTTAPRPGGPAPGNVQPAAPANPGAPPGPADRPGGSPP